MDMIPLVGILIPIFAILMVGLIVLVPVAGLTARFALRPAIEAYAKLRSAHGDEGMVRVLDQRVSLMERQIENLEATIRHLEELQHVAPARDAPRITTTSASEPQVLDAERVGGRVQQP